MVRNIIVSKSTIELLIELSSDYENIVSLEDIEKFKSIATEIDERYINNLINNCVHWTMDKYCQKLKRDEKRILQRVKFRIERS
jgi:hypothetical protein